MKPRAVPNNAGRSLVRKFSFPHQIATAQLNVVDIETARCHVHEPFHHERGNRSAYSAVRSAWGFASCDPAHTAPIGVDAIRPGQEADHLDRLQSGSPGIDRVRADIADHIGGKCKDSAVLVERKLRIDSLVEGLRGREEILQAIAGPSDSPLEMTRENADQNLLGIERGFAAEPAAHVLGHDTDTVPRQIQEIAKRVAHDPGHLCR